MKKNWRLMFVSAISFAVAVIFQSRILPEEVWSTYSLQGSSDHLLMVSYQHLVEGRPGNVVIRTTGKEDVTQDYLPPRASLRRTSDGQSEITLPINPIRMGEQMVPFRWAFLPGGGQPLRKEFIMLTVDANPSIWHRVWLSLVLWAGLVIPALALYFYYVSRRTRQQILEEEVARAQQRAEAEPEKVKFAWDLARVKLEAYFDRNLTQINQIFLAAIVVMVVGFVFVLIGVALSVWTEHMTVVHIVTTGAGVITEFIGATFMAIYRSTMAQANEFMSILERINTVGMAVQVLDSIPDSEQALKNDTRTQIVNLLLRANVGHLRGPETRHSSDKARSEVQSK